MWQGSKSPSTALCSSWQSHLASVQKKCSIEQAGCIKILPRESLPSHPCRRHAGTKCHGEFALCGWDRNGKAKTTSFSVKGVPDFGQNQLVFQMESRAAVAGCLSLSNSSKFKGTGSSFGRGLHTTTGFLVGFGPHMIPNVPRRGACHLKAVETGRSDRKGGPFRESAVIETCVVRAVILAVGLPTEAVSGVGIWVKTMDFSHFSHRFECQEYIPDIKSSTRKEKDS